MVKFNHDKRNFRKYTFTRKLRTVDGPGVRFVVFTQGCPLRCKYCHNPDSWEVGTNKKFSVNEILEKYDGVKEFCKGGITVTGGEPLLQMDFVTALFKRSKKLVEFIQRLILQVFFLTVQILLKLMNF